MQAWTQDDLALVNEAIATGAQKVRFSADRETTFRTLAELRSIRAEILASIGPASAQPVRCTYASFTRD